MKWLVTVELRVLTGSLDTVPEVHELFNLHKFEWMSRSLGSYSEEIVGDFYATYIANLRGSIDRRVRPAK